MNDTRVLMSFENPMETEEQPPMDDRSDAETLESNEITPEDQQLISSAYDALREEDISGADQYMEQLRQKYENDELPPGLADQIGELRDRIEEEKKGETNPDIEE